MQILQIYVTFSIIFISNTRGQILIIIRQVCGFLVQILPCAFFCIYPFKNDFKINFKKAVIIFASVLLIMSAIFSAVATAHYTTELKQYKFMFQDIVFYLTIAILLISYVLLIKQSKYKKLFIFFIVLNYGFLLMSGQNLAFNALNIPDVVDDYMYPTHFLLISICVNILAFIPMFLLIKK